MLIEGTELIAPFAALSISVVVNILLLFKMLRKSRQIDLNMRNSNETIAALKEAIAANQTIAEQEKEVSDAAYKHIEELTKTLQEEQEKYSTLLSQKKSSEVRLGQIGEHLAPFLDSWPWDSKRFKFLGEPIDGIQFDDDEITFVEIKTGKSQLNKRQRTLRDLIKEKKVSFAVFRIGEKECQVKKS